MLLVVIVELHALSLAFVPSSHQFVFEKGPDPNDNLEPVFLGSFLLVDSLHGFYYYR